MFATPLHLLHHERVRRALGLGMFLLTVAAVCLFAFAPDSLWAVPAINTAADALKKLPRTLRETGLYAPGTSKMVREGIASFSPQYALWSDGAEKRRWLFLPPGTFIDASNPDEWIFPPGTRLWKEFALQGRPVETRFIERLGDGSWRFAAYVWNESGDEAVLAPAEGVSALPVRAAPAGRYSVPSRQDCLACHGSTSVPVLGVSALQLSSDRDPLVPGARPRSEHEVDLRALVARGWLRRLPAELLERPPVIAAATPVERAALGYLHGNCGHCHNSTDARVPVRLRLAQRAADPEAARQEALRSAIDAASRYRPPGSAGPAVVVSPGSAEHSVLAVRMESRDPHVQMPPLGTSIPDPEGLALIRRWIDSSESSTRSKETSP